jgi:hypothetical protein
MGKARRRKAHRQQARTRLPRGGRPLNSIEDIEANEEVWTPDMPGRVTYLDDPVLGAGQPAVGISPDGQFIPDNSGTTEPIPVVMFEPAQVVLMRNTVTGLVQETKTEAIVAQGFHRIPDGMVWTVRPAPGWEVRRLPGELVLRDGTGEIWARSKITPDPAWISAAASQRNVVVFYGPKLGVRTPPGMNPVRYGTAKRAAEFRQGRREGLVTAATVTWRGAADGETLDWSTFLPGSFCQPLPGVFAPVANFTRHGGPDTFGLSRLGDHDLSVPAEVVKTLLARVSRTDIDLIDPAEAPPFNWLGGVHYSEGVHAGWREAALSGGRVLLLTGHSLPAQPPAEPLAAREILSDLWGAVVQVQTA